MGINDEGDWLAEEQFDAAPPKPRRGTAGAGGPRSAVRRWWPVLPVGLAILVGAVLVIRGSGSPTDSARPGPAVSIASIASAHSTPEPSTALTPTSTATGARTGPVRSTSSADPTTNPVTVTRLRGPIVDTTADWELLGVSYDGTLVRIEPAKGLVTTTAPPPAPPDADYSNTSLLDLLAVPGQTLVSIGMSGTVRRFVVEDGEPARPAGGLLAVANQIWPGPKPGQWWVGGANLVTPNPAPGSNLNPEAVVLVGSDGQPAGQWRQVPGGAGGSWSSDGVGGLLYSAAGGVYRVGEDGPRLVTSGEVEAISNGRLFTVECDDKLTCAALIVDARSGARRPLPDLSMDRQPARVVLSPDGKLLASWSWQSDGTKVAAIHNLDNGHTVRLDSIQFGSHNDLVFSPDDRYLFSSGDAGEIIAIATTTGKSQTFDRQLPRIEYLTVRGTGR